MSKRLSVSIPEWAYNSYLEQRINKSGFVLEMIIKGLEVTEENMPEIKRQMQNLSMENSDLREQLKRTKLELEGLKARTKKHIMSDSERMSKAIKNAGLMSLRRKE